MKLSSFYNFLGQSEAQNSNLLLLGSILVGAGLVIGAGAFLAVTKSAAREKKGIIIIGNPRSLTTALERYFINRGDYKMYHEPIIRHIFSRAVSFVSSPYDKDFDASKILEQIARESAGQKFLIKELAWSLSDASFLETMAKEVHLVFIIRSPEQAVVSHEKLEVTNKELAQKLGVDLSFNSTINSVNYDHMQAIFMRIKAVTGKNPILIDADQLANNPEAVIERLCRKLGIDFDKRHLQWASGEATLWPYTKDTWQKDVTASTGFTPLKNAHKLTDLDPQQQAELGPLIERNETIYRELLAYKM